MRLLWDHITTHQSDVSTQHWDDGVFSPTAFSHKSTALGGECQAVLTSRVSPRERSLKPVHSTRSGLSWSIP